MMFFKLSLKNIKQSLHNYTIYFITLIIGVSIFYTFNAMDAQTALVSLSSSKRAIIKSMIQMLDVVSVIVSIILGYLIIYANNFLIRRRKKEFGLYQTLGMSKTKISQLLLVETVIVGIISLIVGLFVGIFLSQGMSVLIIHMFEADMTKFQFSFSAASTGKTCIYFAIIYLLVMVFNVFTISRYKLINLLNASKKNEVLKTKSNLVSVIMFIVSMIFIGTAYYLLRGKHVLLSDLKLTVVMLVLGTLGTYLLFSSLAGFLLKLVQTRKNTYYKNLNMFVLRQVNSRVNTMKLSMTIISIMLLLTIGIMSSALSLVSAMNTDIESANLCDITLKSPNGEKSRDILKQFKADGFDTSKYFNETVSFTLYEMAKEDGTMNTFIGDENVKKIENKFGTMVKMNQSPLYAMKESEYNRLMKFYGRDGIALKGASYALDASLEEMMPYYKEALKTRKTVTIGGKTYAPQIMECIENPLENSSMKSEMGTFILPDSAFTENPNEFTRYENKVCANYVAGDKNTIEENYHKDFKAFYKKGKKEYPYELSFSRIEMANAQIGTTAMSTFLGLYLGIIFSITSAAILAIGQLSESADNKERYAILRKIGVDNKMINMSLLLQIGIYFILPLAVAIVHSFVGLREVARLISVFGNMQLDKNIAITALFIIIVYGTYFLATYVGSKGIIKEKEKYIG